MIEVFPHPGVPVSMYRFMVPSNSDLLFDENLRKLDQHGEPSRQGRKIFGRSCNLSRWNARVQKLLGI